MEYKYTSIILGKKDVGETDRIYSLYTLEGGKIQTLAKSVRKSGAKLAGLLENFTYVDISVARNQGMGKITGAVVENNFSSLRMEYDSISKAFESLNIFNKLVDLNQRDPELFMLLKEYLEAIDSQSLVSSTILSSDFKDKIDLLSAIFLFKLLNSLGYGIELDLCAECGKEYKKSQDEEFFFSAKSGGLICDYCARNIQSQLKLSGNTIKLMRLSLENGIKPFMKLKVKRKDVDFLSITINEILAWI